MPSVLARLILFLSSYIPLLLILLVLFWDNRIVAVTAVAMTLVGLAGLILFFGWSIPGREPTTLTPIDVRRADSEVMAYIVSYVMPFLALGFEELRQIVALAIFLMVIAIIYVNSGMIHINPILNLMGYRLYEVVTKDGATFAVLSRTRLVRGERVSVVRVGDDLCVARRRD